jgi:hypothetical protein
VAKTCVCDNCKAQIGNNDIRISLKGFTVRHNENKAEMPKGFSVETPEDFCSFTCLANWADEQQVILDDYKKICAKRSDNNAE